MLFRAEERSISVSGSRMDYVVFGRGAENLLLVPGLSLRSVRGSGLPLAYMYRMFARDYRVWVFDRRAEAPEGVTIADLAEDLAAAMGALGIRRADVLGVSQGGMIAQELALRHPDRVRRLALAVTLSRPNDTLRRVVAHWVDLAGRGDYPGIVRDMMENMYSEGYRRRYGWLFPILLKAVKLNEPERFIRLTKACLTCDTYGRLGELRCPVLVLGGTDDRIVTGEASREIAKRLGCPIFMYEGLGHSAYEEGKDFNRRVYDFFRSGGPEGGEGK